MTAAHYIRKAAAWILVLLVSPVFALVFLILLPAIIVGGACRAVDWAFNEVIK